MPDGGEGAFNWVCCSDVFPVFGWEVIKGQKNVAIFDQLTHGFVVFHAVCFDEKVERLLRIHTCLCLPNVM